MRNRQVTPRPPPSMMVRPSGVGSGGSPESVASDAGKNPSSPPSQGQVDMTSAYGEYLRPQYREGDVVLDVECGGNNGLLYLSKLCQGSKGPCILFRDMWLTPNEFQYVSGRETAKDWKRSIRHHGKSMKLLLSKGILAVHPPACDCDGCRISSPVNRGRLAEKRAAAHPLDPRFPSRNGCPEQESSPESSREVSNGQPEEGIPASGYTNYIEEIKALIQTNRGRRRYAGQAMDGTRKHNSGDSPEPRKESRLTSIIDQLLINKTKDMHQTEDKKLANSNAAVREEARIVENNGAEGGSLAQHAGIEKSCLSPEATEPRSASPPTTTGVNGGQRKFPLELAGNLHDGRNLDSAVEEEIVSPIESRILPSTPLGGCFPQSQLRPDSSDLPSPRLSPQGRREPPPEGLRRYDSGEWYCPEGGDTTPVSAPPPLPDAHRGQQPVPGGVLAAAAAIAAATPRACVVPLLQPATTTTLLQRSVVSSTFSRPGDMPADALVSAASLEPAAVPVKDERVTPDPESSPSVSPHSPSPGRAFPVAAAAAAAAASVGCFGLRSPVVSTSPFSLSPGLDRFSPAAISCGSPAIKQMEMMTRNYSDFMRSLAAKYNTQSSQDSFPYNQTNGLTRALDGSFPFKTTTPPLLSRTLDVDCNSRKSENHSSPPVLGEHRSTPYSVSDFSSSQTLLNLVRTASAQSASQLENYLRGASKRPQEGENRSDPLDLSLTASKRPRLDSPSSPHSSKLHSPSARDLRDVMVSVKLEGDASGSPEASPNSKGGSKKSPHWLGLLDGRSHRTDLATARASPKSGVSRGRCLSLCTDQSCSTKSEASDVVQWTVDDVVRFVTSVDTCAEYAEKFREQSIDGASLPLLTEEHLTMYMGMKLGPALKLRSTLARLIGHCAVCMHCIHCHGDETERRSETSRSPSVSK